MNTHFLNWRAVPEGMWKWPNFTPEEMADRKSGALFFVPEFMDLLQTLRTKLGFPLPINSAYRTLDHDRAIGGANVHPSGEAVDINVWGKRYVQTFAVAYDLGFKGFGSKQHGPYNGRFIHLDTINDEDHKRIWGWTYK